jgi:hypothetical protein
MSFKLNRRQFIGTAAVTVLAPPILLAVGHEIKARMGTHGMVLFGGAEGLYASHMPMFHKLHDVQTLLRLSIDDRAIAGLIGQQLSQQPALWTIEPERFDLSRLSTGHSDPIKSFEAKVFSGHFERGGMVRYERVRFNVESVPQFRQLDATKRSQATQEFFWFGKGQEHFLIKKLDQRPDIDLIGYFTAEQPKSVQQVVSVKSTALAAPTGAVEQELLAALQQAGVRVKGGITWVYVETGDLV